MTIDRRLVAASLILLSACATSPPPPEKPIEEPTVPAAEEAEKPRAPQTYAEALCFESYGAALGFAEADLRSAPQDPLRLFQRGYALFQSGRAMAARQDFDQVLSGSDNPPYRAVCPDGSLALSGPVKALARAQMSAVNAALVRMNVTNRQVETTTPIAPSPAEDVMPYRERGYTPLTERIEPLSLLPGAEPEKAAPAVPSPTPAQPIPAAVSMLPGAAIVQLGLFSQQPSIDAHWQRVSTRFPALPQGVARWEDSIASGDRRLSRLSLGGFQSLDAAKTFCGQLKSLGIDCFAKSP